MKLFKKLYKQSTSLALDIPGKFTKYLSSHVDSELELDSENLSPLRGELASNVDPVENESPITTNLLTKLIEGRGVDEE